MLYLHDTWQNGRQLAGMSKDGTTVSFKYNAAGLRTRKIVNGVVTNYTLHGKNVVHMTRGNDSLHFFYDASSKPAVAVYNGVSYSYVKNLQGDVVAILDAAGNVVVSYVYDAWGRLISKTGSLASTLGTVQPFRYRGYVDDEETGLYYLRSRYYNPIHCRFVNADCLLNDGILNTNQQTYCVNNPVMLTDGSGRDWDSEDYNNLLPGCDFVNIGGCYQVNIPSEAVWSSVYATPLYSGMWSGGLVGPNAEAIYNCCIYSRTGNKSSATSKPGKPKFSEASEKKAPTAVDASKVCDVWDSILGPNTTNINPFTGVVDPNRIFQENGIVSIRMGNHEFDSLSTTKAHFHIETWVLDEITNEGVVYNTLQRINMRR